MGRNSTGAWTTGRSTRIELSYLLELGYLQKDSEASGSLSWSNGSSISIQSKNTENEKYIRLVYTSTSWKTGEKTDYDYKIMITTVASNLGKGEILYFVCPETGKKCRILYNSYNSGIYKSRDSYKKRLYYTTQIVSKYDYNTTRYFAIEKEILKLNQQVKKTHYQGKATKLQQRINRLENELEKFDFLRWVVVPKAVAKQLKTPQYKDFGKF